MKLAIGLLLAALGGCLSGCEMKLKTPAEAFGVGSQKDRTVVLKKGLFSAKAEIPLTDTDIKLTKATFNPETGAFEIEGLDAKQNWSSTLTLENARISENQNLYLAMTTAQQEVYDRQIDALKETAQHGLDAAAMAIGALVRLPGGQPSANGILSTVMDGLSPQMLQPFLASLTRYGVPLSVPNPNPTPPG